MKILGDFATQTWIVADEETLPSLTIGFRQDGSQNVVFDNLSFGYKVMAGRKTIASATYPAEGIQYVSSDQDHIISDNIEVTPDTTYSVSVWAENAGTKFEQKFSTSTPPAPVVEVIEDPIQS